MERAAGRRAGQADEERGGLRGRMEPGGRTDGAGGRTEWGGVGVGRQMVSGARRSSSNGAYWTIKSRRLALGRHTKSVVLKSRPQALRTMVMRSCVKRASGERSQRLFVSTDAAALGRRRGGAAPSRSLAEIMQTTTRIPRSCSARLRNHRDAQLLSCQPEGGRARGRGLGCTAGRGSR